MGMHVKGYLQQQQQQQQGMLFKRNPVTSLPLIDLNGRVFAQM
jgi:hypothetical protein